ncbi:hypothetical protein ACFV1W_27115 [Kitasatospora sp. NPDC059648]|uniref:hypothetical protein n=1 Tax=Kitasatospora sp. NPDC059648 TaxID=3346894 RepID=UPI0036A21F93
MPRQHRHLVAAAGSLALPYIVLKAYWAAGGRAGMADGFHMADEFRRNGAPAALVWLERHGIDFTSVLALTGVALALLLAHRPPIRPLPRRLLLASAWAGTLLIPYGLLTAVFGALGSGAGDAPLTGWVGPAGAAAFVGIGTALGLSAWPHRTFRRTAPAG